MWFAWLLGAALVAFVVDVIVWFVSAGEQGAFSG